MREFKVFRALGLSFRAWFRSFVDFTLLGALLFAPIFVSIALVGPSADEDQMELLLVLSFVVATIVSTLLAPLLIHRVVQDLDGKPTPMLTSVRVGFRGALAELVAGLGVLGAGVVPVIGGILSMMFRCKWFVAAPAAVVEKRGPLEAVDRSGQLTEGRRWAIFGLYVLIVLVTIAVSIAWMIVALTISDTPRGHQVALLGVAVVIGAMQLFKGVVAAVTYVMLRGEKEGPPQEQLGNVFD